MQAVHRSEAAAAEAAVTQADILSERIESLASQGPADLADMVPRSDRTWLGDDHHPGRRFKLARCAVLRASESLVDGAQAAERLMTAAIRARAHQQSGECIFCILNFDLHILHICCIFCIFWDKVPTNLKCFLIWHILHIFLHILHIFDIFYVIFCVYFFAYFFCIFCIFYILISIFFAYSLHILCIFHSIFYCIFCILSILFDIFLYIFCILLCILYCILLTYYCACSAYATYFAYFSIYIFCIFDNGVAYLTY
jgi:hypothetical protein